MIPIESLRNVKRVVTHAHCPDGRASAVILHAVLPDAEVVEMVHNSAEHKAKTALRTVIAGRRVAIVSSRRLTEDAADVIGDEVDIVAGFDYVHTAEGVDLQWSLRARNGTDVCAIARANGGNGHTAAAGFKVAVLGRGEMRIDSPYVIAETVLAWGAQ